MSGLVLLLLVLFGVIVISDYCTGASVSKAIEKRTSDFKSNNTELLDLYQKDIDNVDEARAKKKQLSGGHQKKGRKKKKDESLMTKIMPMFVLPFLMQSSMVPVALASLKFMLAKSLLIGKLALILMAINALKRIDNKGTGTVVHQKIAAGHYGYTGDEEYGAWVN